MIPTPPQIAVVDDEDSVRKALARLLRAAGMGVESFSSGGDFLRFLPDHAIDCVILDLHMPTVSGFDILERLAEQRSPVAVVVITGHDTPESQARVLAAGAAAYLLKPVDEQVLLGAIATAIGRSGNPVHAESS
ncbi:MAG TPA: response regulator [Azonexus sp.]